MAQKIQVLLSTTSMAATPRKPSASRSTATTTRSTCPGRTRPSCATSFAKYVGAARKVGRSTARPAAGPARRSGGTSTAMDRDQAAAIRSWAKKQGLKVSDRGRIPATIVEQYNQSA